MNGSMNGNVNLKSSRKRRANVGPPNQSLVTKQQVRDMIRSTVTNSMELKCTDADVSSSNTYYSSFNLVNTAIGATLTTRVGNYVNIKRLLGKLTFTYADTTNAVRVLIIQWKGLIASGGPVAGQVLSYPNSVLTPMSPLLQDDAYTLVYDSGVRILTSSQTALAINFDVTTGFNSKVSFDGTSNASNLTNGLFLITLNDSAASPNPSVVGLVRCYYTD